MRTSHTIKVLRKEIGFGFLKAFGQPSAVPLFLNYFLYRPQYVFIVDAILYVFYILLIIFLKIQRVGGKKVGQGELRIKNRLGSPFFSYIGKVMKIAFLPPTCRGLPRPAEGLPEGQQKTKTSTFFRLLQCGRGARATLL